MKQASGTQDLARAAERAPAPSQAGPETGSASPSAAPPRPLRVLYVITRAVIGGAQTHLQQLLACDQIGERALVVGESGPCSRVAQELGLPVWLAPSLGNSLNPLRDVRAVAEVAQAISRFQPDLVHAHSSKAGTIARLAARRCGVPVVFTVHGWAFADGVPWLRRRAALAVERRMAPLAERIICVSEADRELAIRRKVGRSEQLVCIWNGVPDLPLGSAQPERTVPRCIMVARFAPPKDQALLFRAVAASTRPMEVWLVGDGELMAAAQKLAVEIGVADRTHFLGDREDVPELLRQSDIFVLASRWEGFPISVLEAMRAGLPVVASDVGGIREQVVDGETGYLVPPGDAASLAERLDRLAADPDLRRRLGQAGRARFLEHFTLDKMLAATLQVYQRVVASAGMRVFT